MPTVPAGTFEKIYEFGKSLWEQWYEDRKKIPYIKRYIGGYRNYAKTAWSRGSLDYSYFRKIVYDNPRGY